MEDAKVPRAYGNYVTKDRGQGEVKKRERMFEKETLKTLGDGGGYGRRALV